MFINGLVKYEELKLWILFILVKIVIPWVNFGPEASQFSKEISKFSNSFRGI